MSQTCPDTAVLKLDPNSLLDFKCGSSCSTDTFEWFKRERGKKEETKLDVQGPTMTVQSVYYNHGGVYGCRCLPEGPLCEQDVYSEIVILFISYNYHVVVVVVVVV